MKGKFNCFIGIDGAGKTTLINHVLNHTSNDIYIRCRFEGFKVFYLFHYIMKRVVGLKKLSTDYTSEGVSNKKRIFSKPPAKSLYATVVFIDYCFQIWAKVFWPLYACRGVIYCDRYIYDTAIDLASEFGKGIDWVCKVLKIISCFTPNPDNIILVDVEPEIAFERAKKKGDMIPYDFLVTRRMLYIELAGKMKNITVIDTKKDFYKAQERVRILTSCPL